MWDRRLDGRSIVLLVFGGRDYERRYTVWHRMLEIIAGVPFNRVIIRHGACSTGADRHAHAFCEHWKATGIVEDPCPAKWADTTVEGAVIRKRADGTSYNVLAGFMRNQAMLDREPRLTHALGTPGGRGTRDMRMRIEAANRDGAGIELIVIA